MRRSFFLSCALVVSGAMGAGASDTTGTFLSPHQLPDSIVVTANRFGVSEARSIWPTAVIALDRAESPALDAALEGEAGVDIRNYNGQGSVATLSNWGVFNRHMLLLYNGRAVKDYSLGGFNLADYSPNELARIEIVKGPQSAFYGSDAVGGVVNLLTPSALVDRLEARTTMGSFGARSYFADAARKLGRVGLGAWAEYAEADNRRDNAGAKRTIAGVRSDWIGGAHRVSFTARYFEDSLGVPGPVPEPGYAPDYGNDEATSLTARQEDANYSADLQYRFFSDRRGEAQVDLFWEKKNLNYRSLYNYDMYYTTIDSSVSPADTIQQIDSVDVHTRTVYNKRSAGAGGRYLREIGAVSLAGGIDWLSGSLRTSNTDRSLGTNIVGPGAPFEYEYATFTYWNAGQDQFDVWGSSRWAATGGVQLDASGRVQFVHNRRAQPSYNLGAIVKPTSALALKIGYAYAYRLPSLAEQFADDVFTQGNARLNPEVARTLAATASFAPTENVSARATYFHQEIDSLIQYQWDPSIFRSVPRNFARFLSDGLDAQIEAAVRRDLTIRWAGVWQEARQSAPEGGALREAAYVPDLKWRLGVAWSRSRLAAGASVTFTSERAIYLYDDTRKTIESVYELGARAGFDITGQIRVTLTGEDLTDERRADQFGFTAADGDYPGLGRRFYLEAAFRL